MTNMVLALDSVNQASVAHKSLNYIAHVSENDVAIYVTQCPNDNLINNFVNIWLKMDLWIHFDLIIPSGLNTFMKSSCLSLGLYDRKSVTIFN